MSAALDPIGWLSHPSRQQKKTGQRVANVTTVTGASWPKAFDQGRVARERSRWMAAGLTREETAQREVAWNALEPAMAAVFGNSPYLTQLVHAEPDLLGRLINEPPATLVPEELARAQALGVEQRRDLLAGLRRCKRRIALLAALGDLGGTMEVMATTQVLAQFADIAVDRVLRFLLKVACDRGELDRSVLEPEQAHGIVVLGMGKHGAFELNYSSDIDLIVFYDPERMPCLGRGTPASVAVWIARSLTQTLEEKGRDGYVFRTDLRLRPYPAGQPLALSVDAAELYYERHGQNWERAAYIKARAVAGDPVAGEDFLKRITPFVWRRSLDYNAITDIHSIKRQIHAQHGHGDLRVFGHNIKLGRGGIREIEFFAQTQQLILGGRRAELRDRTTLGALKALADGGWVAEEAAADLHAAYVELRRIEHRLQMIDDAQTHTLPPAGTAFDRVARFAGFEDAELFAAHVQSVLARVEERYAALFESSPDLSDSARLVFAGVDDDPGTLAHLQSLGFADAKALSQRVRQWHHGHIAATRSERAREILTELMPELIRALARQPDPDGAFRRFDAFLSALPAGMQLFAMLHSNPRLFDLVATVMGAAPSLAERLAANPRLFDAALVPGFLDDPVPKARLVEELAITAAAAQSFEDLLDRVRVWGQSRQFQIELQVLLARQPTQVIQQSLSDLAEVLLEALLPAAEDWLAAQHGRVPGGRFAVLAFGKLGSRQLSIGSDLDLVFVYDAAPNAASDGRRPLPAPVYFARLGQRLIAAISARTAEGRLYEIDMRLRPSGNSGPMATTLDNFKNYQRQTAQTWEHQALCRARPVVGEPSLCTEVQAEIDAVVSRERDPSALAQAVVAMRRRVFAEHGSNSPWDCKQAPGGILSIDFVAQFLVLRHAAHQQGLLHLTTDGVLQQAAELGLVDPVDASALHRALALNEAIDSVLRLTLAADVRPEQAPIALQQSLLRFSEMALGDDQAAASVDALRETLAAAQADAEAAAAHIYGLDDPVLVPDPGAKRS